MRGLITKDILILRNQWKTLAMIFLMGVVMAVMQQPETLIAYLPIIMCMVILGTFTYDEMDNGYRYLFTLPASRKTYVKEKYLFSFIAVVVTIAFSIIACVVVMMLTSEPPLIEWNEIMISAATIFVFDMLLLAVEIPLRLKYGIEKGKMILYVVFGFLAITGILIAKLLPKDSAAYIETYLNGRSSAIPGVVLLASVIILYFSSLWSTRILTEKEF